MNARADAWEFIRRGLAPKDDSIGHERLRRMANGPENIWPWVVRLADDQLVSPALWLGLKDKGLTADLPEEPRQYLESMYTMNLGRNGALMAQLDEAVRVLNGLDIVPVLLKGASYLKTGVYPDSGARILSDLDLLIEPEQIPNALEALRDAGYAASSEATPEYWAQHHHCRPLFRPGDFGSIEIHKRLFSGRNAEIFSVEQVWDELIDASANGSRLRCLSPTHTVIVSFMNSQIVDRFDARFLIGLRPMLDLLALEATYPDRIDWAGIHTRMQHEGEGRRFREYIYALGQLTDVCVLPEIRFGIRERLHYAMCRASMRSDAFSRWADRIDGFSAYRIRQNYRCGANPLSVNTYRLVQTVELIARRVRMQVPFESEKAASRLLKDSELDQR